MKKIAFAIVGAASLALAACGGQNDDSLGENAQEAMEAQDGNLDALAADAANQEAEALGNQAEQLRDEGEQAPQPVEADENAVEADPDDAEEPVQGM